MRRIVSIILLLCLATSLFACGNKPTESTADSPTVSEETAKTESGAKEVVTLRIWGGVPAEAGPQESIDAFNQAFKDKGIQAEYERYVNDDTGNMKLETSLLGGGDIDLYMSYTSPQLAKRAQGSMALDLSELCARDGFEITKYFGELAKSYYVDGKPYCLPTKLDQYGMVVNKDMFDAAGIPVPTEWTYEEFREIAKKLTHGEGEDKVYGVFWNSQQDLTQYANFFISQTEGGDPMYSEDGTKTAFNTPTFKATIALINDTMNVDKSAPTHTDSVTQKLSQESMFLNERAAMTIGPWMVRNIKDTENYPHDFVTAFAPYPVFEGKRNYTQGGYGDFLCINPQSENIDAAWEYAKWYATEGMLPLVKGGRVPSSNTYDIEEVTVAFMHGAEELLDAETAKNVLISPRDNYAAPSHTNKIAELIKVMSEEVEAVYTGKKDVDQAMADAQMRGDELLAS